MANAAAIRAWRIRVALGLLLAICRLPVAWGQGPPTAAPLPPNQGEANFLAPPAGVDQPGGVCPECGQPYNQPGGEQPPGPRAWPLIGNLFLHPPWDLSGGPLDPIWRESWLYRPYSVGVFVGDAQGSELQHDWIGMGQGVNWGVRAGWDWSHYWGAETRLAWNWGSLYDEPLAQEMRALADARLGISPNDPAIQQLQNRSTTFLFWDVDLLYYPWGDYRWRPYFLVGMGASQIHYMDLFYNYYDHSLLTVPIAIGVKYRWNDRIALRLELNDTIVFSDHGADTLDLVSLTFGVEMRFGGTEKLYWPWKPSNY